MGGDEDGVEDRGEVDGVDGGGEVGCDDGAGVGDARGGLLAQRAALDAVELEVDPPDAGDGEEQPEEELAGYGGEEGEVMEDEEVEGRVGGEEREADEEEERVGEGREEGGGGRDGDEGGYAGACVAGRRLVDGRAVKGVVG